MTAAIHIVTPIFTEGVRSLDDVRPLEKFGLEIRHSLLSAGPASIECEFDEALAVPDTIRKCLEAEAAGADAVIIDCMGDPGLSAVREVLTIPVLGPMQTSMHLAAMLGHRMSVITVVDSVVPMIADLAKLYGLSDRLASIRVIDLPVLEIETNLQQTQELLAEQSIKAVREDDADVLIFGCTGFLGCADAIISALKSASLNVPVIDPIPVTVLQAAAIHNAGHTHSKKTYPFPRTKAIRGYSVPGFELAG